MRSPNSPAATPVATTISQNFGVSAASPSPVALGCSVAPRPDGSRWLIGGGGPRTAPGSFSWRGGFVTAPRFPPKRVRRPRARPSGPRALPAGGSGHAPTAVSRYFRNRSILRGGMAAKRRGGEHFMIEAASLSRGLTPEAGFADSAWIAAFRGILTLGNEAQLEPAAERRGSGAAVLATAGRAGPRGSSAYIDARWLSAYADGHGIST